MKSVSVAVEGGIAVVTVNHPPVNALSHAVRIGLIEAAEQVDADAAVCAAMLICAGKTFIAGADIAEFDLPAMPPLLPDVVARLANAAKPWIAAIHGSALGGGLEIALGCHYRIADEKARFGFPEVNLGLIPGAGGTVCLPRLIAPAQAIRMICGGKPVGARQAAEWGLIDKVIEGDLQAAAAQFAHEVADLPLPPAVAKRAPVGQLSPSEWEMARADIVKTARGQIAPVAAFDAIRDAIDMPVAQAMAEERRRFLDLRNGEQSKALRYVFRAEKSVPKVTGAPDAKARHIDHVAVIGGGTMGSGIAAAVLLAGYSLTMIERDDAALERGMAVTRSHLEAALKRGVVNSEAFGRMIAGLSGSTDFGSLARADLIVEAVFEDMDVKRELFARLDEAARPDAILATNTSYLDVNAMARATRDPSRVIGLHFFSPAHIMKLLEIVRTDVVAPEVLATGFSFAARLGKIAVLSGVCDGFIGNRIMSAYRRECEFMLEDGALPHEIDAAMTDFGFAMGIFAMQDLAGLDIGWAMRKRQAKSRDPKARYVAIADRLCEQGRFGRKTGAGYYRYAEGSTQGVPDAVTEALILEESAAKAIIRRPLSATEIMDRILGVMRSEGALVLSEGIAASAAAIDVVMINGYGFPRWRGGPMYRRAGRE